MKYTIYCILLSLSPILALDEIDTCLIELANINRNLAIQVYDVIHPHTYSNFVYSPFGMDVLLTYFYMASNRKSRDQIAATGYVPRHIECFDVFLSRLYMQRQNIFNIANRVFVRDDIRLNPKFLENATNYLKTTTTTVHYRDRSDEAVKAINSWVQTQMIDDDKLNVIDLEDIDKSTNIIFVGTVFSDLYWKYQFTPYTKIFHTLDSDIMADMMETHGTFNYYDSVELAAQFVEIPYEDIIPNHRAAHRPLSLVIVLPYARDGISRLESNLVTAFSQLPLKPTNLQVIIPSVRIEDTLDTKEILKNMGVTDMFDIDKADLSNLAFNNYKRYYVTRATQTAQINFNLVGTIAKSASGNVQPTRMRRLKLVYQVFSADHPFMYYIQRDNVILYAGRVMDL